MLGIIIVIILIILLLLFIIINQKNSVSDIGDNDYDYIIVGCGISGAFCAERINRFHPDKKILIVERNTEPGGKLKSDNVGSNIYVEYGGMRFFPKIHIYADILAKYLGLPTTHVNYVNAGNIAYVRGVRYRIGELKDQHSYHLRKNELFHNPDVYVNKITQKELDRLGITWEDALDNQNLSQINFWQFLKMNMSNEMIKFYEDINGYNFTIDNIHCGLAMKENMSIFNDPDSPQLFVQTGMQSFVYGLLGRLNANVDIMLGTELVRFEGGNNKTRLHLIRNGKEYLVRCAKLILTIPNIDITPVHPWPGMVRENFDKVLSWSALKIFIRFKKRWWEGLGLRDGRSVSDLPVRQVWYYTGNIMMVYCDSINTHFWANSLRLKNSNNIIFSQPWTDVNNINGLFVEQLLSQISTIHNYPLTVSMVDKISWTYWPDGAYWWKPCRIQKIRTVLKNPVPDVYLTNSCWSVWQGWINGAIENADELLAQYFGIPSILKFGKN